jgi:hypothetical protein
LFQNVVDLLTTLPHEYTRFSKVSTGNKDHLAGHAWEPTHENLLAREIDFPSASSDYTTVQKKTKSFEKKSSMSTMTLICRVIFHHKAIKCLDEVLKEADNVSGDQTHLLEVRELAQKALA